MRIVALYSIKGGVGKTASAVNLSYLAARDGERTLLLDLDPQGSASFYLRLRPPRKLDTRRLLKGGKRLARSIRGTDYSGLDSLPADLSYRKLDLALDARKRPRRRLREVLARFRRDYDWLFLDCPPGLSLGAEGIFRAADIILVPVIPTTLSVRTYDLLETFLADHKLPRHKLVPFFSLVERRKRLHRDIMAELRERDSAFLATAIPSAIDVERMGLHREPLLCYRPRCVAAQAYEGLWQDLRARLDPARVDGE
jgi:chromosome partitioning protein